MKSDQDESVNTKIESQRRKSRSEFAPECFFRKFPSRKKSMIDLKSFEQILDWKISNLASKEDIPLLNGKMDSRKEEIQILSNKIDSFV